MVAIVAKGVSRPGRGKSFADRVADAAPGVVVVGTAVDAADVPGDTADVSGDVVTGVAVRVPGGVRMLSVPGLGWKASFSGQLPLDLVGDSLVAALRSIDVELEAASLGGPRSPAPVVWSLPKPFPEMGQILPQPDMPASTVDKVPTGQTSGGAGVPGVSWLFDELLSPTSRVRLDASLPRVSHVKYERGSFIEDRFVDQDGVGYGATEFAATFGQDGVRVIVMVATGVVEGYAKAVASLLPGVWVVFTEAGADMAQFGGNLWVVGLGKDDELMVRQGKGLVAVRSDGAEVRDVADVKSMLGELAKLDVGSLFEDGAQMEEGDADSQMAVAPGDRSEMDRDSGSESDDGPKPDAKPSTNTGTATATDVGALSVASVGGLSGSAAELLAYPVVLGPQRELVRWEEGEDVRSLAELAKIAPIGGDAGLGAHPLAKRPARWKLSDRGFVFGSGVRLFPVGGEWPEVSGRAGLLNSGAGFGDTEALKGVIGVRSLTPKLRSRYIAPFSVHSNWDGTGVVVNFRDLTPQQFAELYKKVSARQGNLPNQKKLAVALACIFGKAGRAMGEGVLHCDGVVFQTKDGIRITKPDRDVFSIPDLRVPEEQDYSLPSELGWQLRLNGETHYFGFDLHVALNESLRLMFPDATDLPMFTKEDFLMPGLPYPVPWGGFQPLRVA